MLASTLIESLFSPGFYFQNPWLFLLLAFQIWMLVDALRREEYFWAVCIFLFSFLSAMLYYLFVYRQAQPLASSMRGFEFPGAQHRRRIQELQAQIHHLDKAHHHAELGDIYFQQGKLKEAETAYREALTREPEDADFQAHLGQCLLRQGRVPEARPLLEKVAKENPKHDYGHTLMAYAEALTQTGEVEAALAAWQSVLEQHSYARARYQYAELLAGTGQVDQARATLDEMLVDEAHTVAFERKRDKIWTRKAKALRKSLA